MDDVLVEINKEFFPIDFVVLDMDLSYGSKQITLVLGRLFLAITNVTIM